MGTTESTKKLPRQRDMTGERFGRWVVLGFSHVGTFGTKVWKCRCDCGNEKLVKTTGLRSGDSKSCGCLMREVASVTHKTHGKTNSSEFASWDAMIARCTRRSCASWKYYGGVGVKVSRRWMTFANFLADMGSKPTPTHTIERINNSKGYYKGNCRWATPTEQGRNKSNNRLLTYNGKTQCISAWAVEVGIPANVLYYRASSGWSDIKCLTTPVRKTNVKVRNGKGGIKTPT